MIKTLKNDWVWNLFLKNSFFLEQKWQNWFLNPKLCHFSNSKWKNYPNSCSLVWLSKWPKNTLPEAGQAPDYHDERIAGQMDIEAPMEPTMVEEKETVSEPEAPDHDPIVEHKKVARKFMPKEQRFPKLLIMGVKQCGTIALGRYLKIHPDLVNAGETFFFAKTFSKVFKQIY